MFETRSPFPDGAVELPAKTAITHCPTVIRVFTFRKACSTARTRLFSLIERFEARTRRRLAESLTFPSSPAPRISAPRDSQCAKACLCAGGSVSCHVGRLRIRRKGAKAANLRPSGLDSLAAAAPADLAGGSLRDRAAPRPGSFDSLGAAGASGGPDFSGAGGRPDLLASGVGQPDLGALAALRSLAGLGGLGSLGSLGGLGGLGSLGGFGGFPRGAPGALRNLAELSASHTTATMNQLVALNVQLRQQNAVLQHCTMQLVQQLEREARCAACQKSRSAAASAADGATNGAQGAPSRPDAAPSAAEALERVAAGSRVAALLSSLRGYESPTPLAARMEARGDGDSGDGAPSARVAGAESSPSFAADTAEGEVPQDTKRPLQSETPISVDPTDPVDASKDGTEANGASTKAKDVAPMADVKTAPRAAEGDAKAGIGAKRKSPEPATEQDD